MKIPRKLKKRIIKVFGRGTYNGLRDEYLQLRNLDKRGGVITHLIKKENNHYYPGQHTPNLIFSNIN